MEVGTMQREIRRAVTFLGVLAERNRSEFAARQTVINEDRLGPEGARLDGVERAERRERPRGVRAELDAGAGFLRKERALQDLGLDCPPAERNGGR